MPRAFFNYLVMWLRCLISPVQSINSLTLDVDKGKSVELIFSLWIPPILIGILIQIPVAHMFDVGLNNNMEFLSFSIILIMIMVCASGVLAHMVMRALRLKSKLPCTLALYTIVVIYYPIVNIVLLRKTYQLFNAIYVIKQTVDLSKMDAYGIIIRFLQTLNMHTDGMLYVIDNIIVYASGFIDILCVTAFAEMLVQWYGNTRFKTYVAVGGSKILVLCLGTLIYWPIETFTLYSFIGNARPNPVIIWPQ
jgi:hypothetical protein